MSEERGFTGREIGAFLAFAAAGILLGIGAYRAGGNLAGAGGGAVVAAAPAGATPDGNALYTTNCAACHGAQGQGGVGLPLAPSATWTEAQFAEAVLNGKAPTRELKVVMPRFAATGLDGAPATEAQINAIHAYIKTLKP